MNEKFSVKTKEKEGFRELNVEEIEKIEKAGEKFETTINICKKTALHSAKEMLENGLGITDIKAFQRVYQKTYPQF